MITGKQTPFLTRKNEEQLRIMFKDIQTPFQKNCPDGRKNFLSYNYVLHKFCQLLELDNLLIHFPLLKSREKLREQDKIWKNICKDLKWNIFLLFKHVLLYLLLYSDNICLIIQMLLLLIILYIQHVDSLYYNLV